MHQVLATPGRRLIARTTAASTLVVAAVVLSACTSARGGQSAPNSSASAPGASAAQTSSGEPPSSASAAPTSETVSKAVITTSAVGGATAANPASPVTVSIAGGRLSSVTLTNPAGKKVSGTMSANATSWHTTEALGYSKSYKVTAVGHDAAGLPTVKHSTVTTLTPNNMTMPYIDDIYGSVIEQNATYGVGMVVRVHFDESVDHKLAEKTLKVTTTPAVTGGWYWDDDQNVYWRPRAYYPSGTKVTVTAKVYGQKVGDGLYGQDDQSVSFKIGEKHYSVADAKTHHVKVYFNDQLVRTMPTSMGQGGYVQGKHGQISLWTMPGIYTVIHHENPAVMSSDSYGLPASSPYGYKAEKVYWSTKISTDGIYLHQLDSTVWQQGHANVSHGCLNLNYTNAHWFYQHSIVGDVVKVVHSGGPPLKFWQGGQWSVPWSDWKAGSALN